MVSWPPGDLERPLDPRRPYALALGLVVGFFDFIPLVGPTIAAIVVALATLTVSFPTAAIVLIAFIIDWQRVEDHVVQPLVYGRAVNVNPLVAAIQTILREWWSARGLEAAQIRADEGPAR